MLLPLLLLAAAQSSATTSDALLPPTTEAAILAGAKACIGATVDPAGQDDRLAGWTSATAAQQADIHTDVRVVVRNQVRLVVKGGVDGGCIVQARGDAAFDKAKFLANLSTAAGVAIDGTQPKTDLPNGEFMLVQIGGSAGKFFVQLIVANPNGKLAHVQQGLTVQ